MAGGGGGGLVEGRVKGGRDKRFIWDIDDKNATNGHFFTDIVETFCGTIGNV